MKTQYYMATSLDGFIADPHNSLDGLLQFDMTEDYAGGAPDIPSMVIRNNEPRGRI